MLAQKDEEFVVAVSAGMVGKGQINNSQQELPAMMSRLSTKSISEAEIDSISCNNCSESSTELPFFLRP